MNDCLLLKWIWKIFQEPDAMWFRIIKAKYMRKGVVFESSAKGGSQFWKGLHKVKHLFKWGPCFRSGMVPIANFGMTAGCCRCL
jgi:hypothetical protein